jgi:transcription initiation factor IIE alpha subunit
MTNIDVDNGMETILDLFHNVGNLTTGAILDLTEISKNKVQRRLRILRAAGHIVYIHKPTALYALVDDPRSDVTVTNTPDETIL